MLLFAYAIIRIAMEWTKLPFWTFSIQLIDQQHLESYSFLLLWCIIFCYKSFVDDFLTSFLTLLFGVPEDTFVAVLEFLIVKSAQ